jgi:signal transduction histidine kinase
LVAIVGAFGTLFAAGPIGLSEDPFLAMLVWASYQVGRHAGLHQQPWAASGVLLLLSLNITEPGRDAGPGDVVFPVLLTAGPWLLGLSVQLALRRERQAVEHAHQLLSRREDELERATAEERLRIAQELHDALAHSISAISLQAQVARRAVDAGGTADVDVLRTIERTAQQAMSDTRRLLGVLRVEKGEAVVRPAPDMGDFDTLLDECRRLGQRLQVITTGGEARPLSPAMSAAAFRILQESLTNARRHGGEGTTQVTLDWEAHQLTFEVRNPATRSCEVGRGPGHGITGIVERARAFGGRTQVGLDGSAWVVRVQLPLPALASEPA